ncbi:cytochrome P450 alkane hydroxylase [Salinisphaera sp. PC39]
MHWQIRGLKLLVNAKKKIIGPRRPMPNFVETPIPDVSTLALEDIDLSNPFLYRQDQWRAYFKRLRDEAPVHYQKNSAFGPFWSVTRYEDILFVDKNHELFSSEPLIVLGDFPEGLPVEMFIAMDPPKHDVQRRSVQGVVAPRNLKEMEGLIRARTGEVLDNLPLDEAFNWVSAVSKELTGRMLATLLDFPYEERHKLIDWSDRMAGTAAATGGEFADEENMFDAAADMAWSFSQLWRDKEARRAAGEAPGFDLISMLQGSEDTQDMINRPMEFIGNLALLIVGGNDTTRNSMSGGVLAMNQFPGEFAKLKANPELIPNMVSEIIRWQTPLAHMRRVATQDVELRGQTIKKGDRVLMWYASGNRDERKFENPDDFIIDREGARHHISFGYGIHRCMGNRLAELQLRILWEELLKRFDSIEVVDEPERVQSNFVRGYSRLMVKLTAKS